MEKISEYCIISVTGPYAGESEHSIYKRKSNEIKENGYTFWHHQSYQAKPAMVQELGKAAKENPIRLYLIGNASGGGGGDTKKSKPAEQYALNENGPYKPIPEPIYVETGTRPYALVIKNLRIVDDRMDLWDYSDFFTEKAIKIKQGGSTVCAIRKTSRNDPDRIKSNIRKLIGVADIVEPFGVWLK